MIKVIPNTATAATGSFMLEGTSYNFTIAASSAYNSDMSPWHAFDNVLVGSGWNAGGVANGGWISIIYSAPILVTFVRLKYQSISNFKVQGWNGTIWSDIATIPTSCTAQDTPFEEDVQFVNGTAYLGYRIYISGTYGSGWTWISDITFGVPNRQDFSGQEIIPAESDTVGITPYKGKCLEDNQTVFASNVKLSSTLVEDNKFSNVAAKNSLAVAIENNKATLTPNNKFSYDISDSEGLFKATDSIGKKICVEQGEDIAVSRPGIFFERTELGDEKGHTIFGGFIDDQEASTQYDQYLGISHDIKESNSVPPILRNFGGIDLTVIEEQTYASNHYTLLVTATHQYRSAIVNVHAKTYGRTDFRGSYQLLINGAVAVDYSVGELDITTIDINLSSGQFLKGVNKCWINILHSDGYLEYLDFEVFKEDSNRTSAERLFRDYDGGFDGKFWCPPKILKVGTPPCAMVPDYKDNTLIMTTDKTNISLKNILSIQNLVVSGKSLRILVSFDGRQSWLAFAANAWSTINKDNISTAGMTIDTINAITEAQWGDAMPKKNSTKGKALDLAVYVGNDISDLITYYNGGPPGGTAYVAFPSYPTKITQIVTVALNVNINNENRIIYSSLYPNGYYTYIYCNGSATYFTYNVSPGEIIYGVVAPHAGGHARTYVYGRNYDANIKSIRVNMTVNPFKGYAFII